MADFEAILVYIVIVFVIISLYKEILGAGFTFLLGVTVLGIFGVLSPQEILAGLANEQIAVILLLLILGNIFKESTVLDSVFDKLYSKTKTTKKFVTRTMLFITPLSAFLNNTPLVALLMPYVHNWSRHNKIPLSKLLIPLSYAAILGGCTTLIGTSTNLIVNGLVAEQNIFPNLHELSMFDFVYVGLPMIFIGYFYIRYIGIKLLPERKNNIDTFVNTSRKYIVELQIRKNSKLIGKTINEADLQNFDDLYLFQIIRNEQSLIAVPNDTILLEGDILMFMGDINTVAQMVNNNKSLIIPSVGMFSRKRKTDVVEIVISDNSSMVGKSLKSLNFRAKYDATAIAIHRNGEQISGKLGIVTLKAGDALLLLAGSNFYDLAAQTTDFYIINKVREIRKLGTLRTGILVGGTALVILLSALGITSLFLSLVVLISVLTLLKITTPQKLKGYIDFDLAFIIAMSLSLGTAMIKTGVADSLAQHFIKILMPHGRIFLLAGIYFITAIMAAFITNKAAVALIFPVSLTVAKDLDYNPVPFILVVSYAAAANFMTPVGYQTNTMIYGAGGYKFRDFLKVGTPLTIIYMIVTIFVLSVVFF